MHCRRPTGNVWKAADVEVAMAPVYGPAWELRQLNATIEVHIHHSFEEDGEGTAVKQYAEAHAGGA
jgi:hypothetical protein